MTKAIQPMTLEKRTISPIIFYTLISIITAVVFVSLTISTLLLTDFLNDTATYIIAVLFLFKSLVTGLYMTTFGKYSGKEILLKVIGMRNGQMLGFIIGAAIGSIIWKGYGTIIGGLLFYFLGRWVGIKISFFTADLLERVFQIPENNVDMTSPSEKKKAFLFNHIYLLLPLFFIVITLLLNIFNIQIATISNSLPVARLVIYTLSIVSVAVPWILQYSMEFSPQKYQKTKAYLPQLGGIYSIIPSIFGFFLFIMGAPIIEIICIACFSFIFAVIWLRYAENIVLPNRIQSHSENR